METAALAAPAVRTNVVRTWLSSLENFVRCRANGPMRALEGPRFDMAQGGMGRGRQIGQAGERRDPVRSRGMGQLEEGLGLAHGLDPGPGDVTGRRREILHGSQLAAEDRKDVHRPQHRRGQEAVRRGEVGLGCAQRGQRRPGQEAVGRKLALRILHLIGALADVASGQEDIECGRRHPDHDQGQHHADHDPSPSLPRRSPPPGSRCARGLFRRAGDLRAGGGPVGAVAPARSPPGASHLKRLTVLGIRRAG